VNAIHGYLFDLLPHAVKAERKTGRIGSTNSKLFVGETNVWTPNHPRKCACPDWALGFEEEELKIEN
jgi:hypothetical protein